ncbi:hypothetical protein SEVIR_6G216700v4 [Setaria viridis]|uniref:Sulfotransferase n=1 Tax=Setaria viridis TaxID=4556 RepID=A0A4U6U7T6_SETVI|nr:cytosolic sulfotransferase 5-like [Setaria viridis]TKW11172.1 hypothetical protein SEVIR_6G216700v2 [Setaria viridis]
MADAPQFEKKEHSGGSEGEARDGLTQTPTTLPIREGWFLPLFRLQGCWLTPQRVESVKLVQAQFNPRPDDVLLVTYPKCGTTWLKALAFTVANRSRHPVAGGHHPLLSHNPHDLVPFLELPDRTLYLVAELEALPSPRLLCTHVPPALLPPGTLPLGCRRLVYLCRDPKDVLVSTWHHAQNARLIEFDKAFELFCEGVSVFGPIWEHCLGYWDLSVREPNNVLFLKYDEMMAQPAKHVRMLAEFLGVPFTVEEESDGVVEEVVRLCSFQNLRDLPVNSDGVVAGRIGAMPTKNSMFFRKGKVGDWENYLTEEMARKLDCIIEEKLRGSGLTFSQSVCHST